MSKFFSYQSIKNIFYLKINNVNNVSISVMKCK